MNWDDRIAFQCSCCFTDYTFRQFTEMRSVWINGDEKYGKTAVCPKCGKKFHEGKWQIKSLKDIHIVYTTHLEMPQNPPSLMEDIMTSRYFYETMICNTQTDEFLTFQARYKTQRDAIDGHWLAYDNLEDIILNPEKYPEGFMQMFFNAISAVQQSKDKYSEETKSKSK